jgi:histone deacetylase complex regulatory component SIN3
MFIGESADIWPQFKTVVGADEVARSGGFANMIGVEAGVIENTPVVDRAKLDLSLCAPYGPSYRRLPKTVSALCWPFLT